jgi:lipopolysaccharide transport system ATP-binding protein
VSNAVEAHNLSKIFRRGAIGAATLKEELQDTFSRVTGQGPRASLREFRALDDVSFIIPRGSACGVVGPNGSGKTTLMKILSSISEPSDGEAVLHGKVGSLLEVGAGFEWELSGLDNIYMNGAILGMTRREIDRKLDQIIAFADIGPALETPVKRYSTGMFVRLAFAVTAHLDADILIVDEVLAVGDAEFQRKCLGAMEDVAHQGRTVILVSHNMAAIGQLCDSALYLRKGKLEASGSVGSVIDTYLSRAEDEADSALAEGTRLSARLSMVQSGSGVMLRRAEFGSQCEMIVRIDCPGRLSRLVAQIRIGSQDGELVSTLGSMEEGIDPLTVSGAVEIVFDLGALALTPGSYFADLIISELGDDEPLLQTSQPYSFTVTPAMLGNARQAYSRDQGVVRLARGASVRRVD